MRNVYFGRNNGVGIDGGWINPGNGNGRRNAGSVVIGNGENSIVCKVSCWLVFPLVVAVAVSCVLAPLQTVVEVAEVETGTVEVLTLTGAEEAGQLVPTSVVTV